MKKILLALTAVAAMTGSASAADLAARPYTKAPAPIAVAPSWTGFYIFGGGGGGIWDADTGVQSTATGAPILGFNQRQGGDGWFGTVGAGYDWQTANSWVIGVFADGQFGSLKGTIQDQGPFVAGNIKNDYSWAAGARLGYLSRSERSVLRQRRLLQLALEGHHAVQHRERSSVGPAHQRLRPQRLVRRRRRREQPEHLRPHRAGLVHEDRISCRLLRQQEHLRARRRHQHLERPRHHLQAVRPDHQHLAGLPLQLDRPGCRQVLTLRPADEADQKPRHRQGLLC